MTTASQGYESPGQGMYADDQGGILVFPRSGLGNLRQRGSVSSETTMGNFSIHITPTQDWLASPKREKLWRGLVTRYLRNTEDALSDLNKSTNVVPRAGEPLKGYTAAVVTAINFITDLFPSAKMELENGGQYELCGKVWATVGKRERIVEYWTRKRVQDKPWTISVYGTAQWIAQAAKL